MQSQTAQATVAPVPVIAPSTVDKTVAALVARHGEPVRRQATIGVGQVAALWHSGDGTAEQFTAWCLANFLADPAQRSALFDRLELNLEQIRGHFGELVRFLKRPVDLDLGPMLPVDLQFAAFWPNSHLIEDLFQIKTAFSVLLNFPLVTPEQIQQSGNTWDRLQWAEARLVRRFAYRVPAELDQRVNEALVQSEDYINRYNIFMDHVLSADGQRLFPAGKKLISHWGLRDELKAQYAQPDGLKRQRLIYQVMQRIVRQEIPAVVIDNPDVDWQVDSNTVTVNGKPGDPAREPDLRYRHWLDVFGAVKAVDPYFPDAPSHIDRRFKLDRELPEATVEQLLVAVLDAPVAKQVGHLIAHRLGRPLEPFDIWYDGFKPRGSIPESDLDQKVRARFPTLDHFQKALPDVLAKLGFSNETAAFLAASIEVDPARGAGHAWGAERREDKAHLRTRVPAAGMDYKGFNIAMHELGHSVEQVFSLKRVDHTLLAGVPNTAFTEGFAFMFQGRDLQVLGLPTPGAKAEHLADLDTFWATYEIGGVALVDMRVWRWLYAHPQATPAEMREAVVQIAKEVWNRYYAPVFGHRDIDLLAIYSHMISGALYLPDYPLGHIIAHQIEQYFKGRDLATEMERMCRQGTIAPQVWMQSAVAAPISAKPLLEAAARALQALHNP